MTPAHLPLWAEWLAIACWVAAFWIALWRLVDAVL